MKVKLDRAELVRELAKVDFLKDHPDGLAISSHLIAERNVCPPRLKKDQYQELRVRLDGLIGKETGGNLDRLGQLASPQVAYGSLPLEKVPFPGPLNPKFRFIDLFAGIGGFRIAFQDAGGECVFTSEWNRYAKQTYERNFGEVPFGDITQISEREIPEHDVLCAGFPCQPFSLAGVVKKASLGRKHGFEDETQGTLFFDVARILKQKRPKAFLLENVKNLVSHDKGRTFQVILKTLRELGYKTVEHKVISSAPWVPQKRERIFIAGFLEKTPFNFNQVVVPDTSPTLASILHEHYDTEPEEGMTEIYRGKIRALEKYTLSDKLWKYLENYGKAHKAKGNGFGCSVVGPDDVARTLSARYYKDGSEILIRLKGKNPRMLTPRECSRLMGYDRPHHTPLTIPVSNNQAYRQFGNGVCGPVIDAIAAAMTPHIMGTFDSATNTLESDLKLTE